MYSRTVSSTASHPSFGPIKELASQLNYLIPESVQLFGENMFGIHSIEYDELQSYFYVFAGLKDGSQWMSWDDVCHLARDLDLPTVPILGRQKVCLHSACRMMCLHVTIQSYFVLFSVFFT